MLIVAAPAAVQAIAPIPAFAPIADRPYRLLITQHRAVAGVPRRFVSERRVTFRREAGGWVAEMLLVDVSTDLSGKAGENFLAAAGALRGRPVWLHLDRAGALMSIDDEKAIGAAIAAALPSLGNGLASAAPAVDRATIVEPLLAMIAGADARRLPGHGAVSLPSLPTGGVPLAGEETVTVVPGGKLSITMVAHGTVGTGDVAIRRERAIDPATGLVERQTETRTTKVGDRSLTVESEATLTPVS